MGKVAAASSLCRDDTGEIDEIDRARAREYGLLATLIAHPPDQGFLDELATLRGDFTSIGAAHAVLAAAASGARATDVAREHFGLFVGVGRGELLPHASYYLTGFLNERPLADIRRDLAALGVARAGGVHEPEDHVAILFDVMAGIALGGFAAPGGADKAFFERHVAPWAGRFFADIEAARGARFYRAVGALGAAFLAIEAEGFGLAEGARDA